MVQVKIKLHKTDSVLLITLYVKHSSETCLFHIHTWVQGLGMFNNRMRSSAFRGVGSCFRLVTYLDCGALFFVSKLS